MSEACIAVVNSDEKGNLTIPPKNYPIKVELGNMMESVDIGTSEFVYKEFGDKVYRVDKSTGEELAEISKEAYNKMLKAVKNIENDENIK